MCRQTQGADRYRDLGQPERWSRRAHEAADARRWPRTCGTTAAITGSAFAFFDPLLARPALVVEGDDVFSAARHVGHDEADARIEFAGMPFDLGDDTARLRPASGLIGEVCIGTSHFVRRTPDRPRQQIADPGRW